MYSDISEKGWLAGRGHNNKIMDVIVINRPPATPGQSYIGCIFACPGYVFYEFYHSQVVTRALLYVERVDVVLLFGVSIKKNVVHSAGE